MAAVLIERGYGNRDITTSSHDHFFRFTPSPKRGSSRVVAPPTPDTDPSPRPKLTHEAVVWGIGDLASANALAVIDHAQEALDGFDAALAELTRAGDLPKALGAPLVQRTTETEVRDEIRPSFSDADLAQAFPLPLPAGSR